MESEKLISDSMYHRTLNGMELCRRREAIGLTQFQFAKECGWSKQYQARLEVPELHEVQTETAEKIEGVFSQFSVIKKVNQIVD